MTRQLLCAVMSSTSLLVIACGGGGGGGNTPTSPSTPGTPSGNTVTISGAANAQIGATAQLTAAVRDSAGNPVSATVTWSSSDGTVASVNGSGLVSVSKIGAVTITATAGSASGTFPFRGELSPYTFDFGAVTSAADQRTIQDAVQYAHSYFQSDFGRTITQPTTITGSTSASGCATGGGAAFTGAGTVTFCVGNQGWLTHGPNNRFKITVHEIFHVLQFEMRWLPAAAASEWLVEGSAEYVAFRAMAARGVIPFETALGCMAKEVADFAAQRPPGLPSLEALESPQTFRQTQGPLYALAMIGMHQLAGGALAPVKAFGEAVSGGTQFPMAFTNAFGQSRVQFYAQWPGYLASRPVPASYACGG